MISIRKSLSLSLGLLSVSAATFAQTSPSAAASLAPEGAAVTPGSSVALVKGGGTLGPGNLVINGDFESYGGGTCDSNLPNVTFTSLMANSTAFGPAEEIDVYTDPPCYGQPAISGSRKAGIHSQQKAILVDAFSLDLSSPVVAGDTYTLHFWAEAELYFDLGSVLVGISNSATSFGTLVYTANLTLAGTWESFSSTFTAPVDGSYLTIQSGNSVAWTHIDAFSLVGEGIGTKYCVANPNSTGSPADLFASGSASSAAGTLKLSSAPVPNQNSIFFHGANPIQQPFGNGFLCLTSGIVRGAVVMAVGNVATYTYDNSDAQHSMAAFVGTVRNYQHWYRDPADGGAFFNLSNAISLLIAP